MLSSTLAQLASLLVVTLHIVVNFNLNELVGLFVPPSPPPVFDDSKVVKETLQVDAHSYWSFTAGVVVGSCAVVLLSLTGAYFVGDGRVEAAGGGRPRVLSQRTSARRSSSLALRG